MGHDRGGGADKNRFDGDHCLLYLFRFRICIKLTLFYCSTVQLRITLKGHTFVSMFVHAEEEQTKESADWILGVLFPRANPPGREAGHHYLSNAEDLSAYFHSPVCLHVIHRDNFNLLCGVLC